MKLLEYYGREFRSVMANYGQTETMPPLILNQMVPYKPHDESLARMQFAMNKHGEAYLLEPITHNIWIRVTALVLRMLIERVNSALIFKLEPGCQISRVIDYMISTRDFQQQICTIKYLEIQDADFSPADLIALMNALPTSVECLAIKGIDISKYTHKELYETFAPLFAFPNCKIMFDDRVAARIARACFSEVPGRLLALVTPNTVSKREGWSTGKLSCTPALQNFLENDGDGAIKKRVMSFLADERIKFKSRSKFSP